MINIHLVTNIIFIKRVSYDGDEEDQFVMETPPNVFHITSMEQMFRIQTKMMKRYGREGVMFLLILDEAQNFLLADEYQQDIDRLQTREGIEDEARKRGYVSEGETGVIAEGLPEDQEAEEAPAELPWYLAVGDFVFQYKEQ